MSSVLLWSPVFRDQQASALFQRLQLDPLLLLQLLALLLLCAALARPTLTLQGKGAERLIFVVDTSASMKARDVGSSRLREAQQQAAGLIAEAGQGAEMMVIEAGSQPTIRLHFTRDRDRARRAVFDLDARDQPNHLSEAIRTALALVPPVDPRVRVHVLTDGAFDPAQVREFPDPRVRWVTVGGGSRNVGITQFSVRKAYYGAFDYQAFLSVTNFSDERVSFPLALTVDGQKISEQTIALDPQVKRNVIVPFTLQTGAVVKAVADVRDDLEADNTVHAVVPEPRKLRVLLVSPGNLFLEKALRTDPAGDPGDEGAQRVLRRHGHLRRGRPGRHVAGEGRRRPLRPRQLDPRRRPDRVPRDDGAADRAGLGAEPPRDAVRRPVQGGGRGGAPGAAAGRRQDAARVGAGARSSSCWRSRSGRPCSSASTSSRRTSRCASRSR